MSLLIETKETENNSQKTVGRIKLNSAKELKINDRLQRNSEFISEIIIDHQFVIAKTHVNYTTLPIDKPLHVWRNDKELRTY